MKKLLAWKAEHSVVLMTVMSCLYVFIPHLMLLLSWTCVIWSKPRLVARRIRAHPAWIPHDVDHDLGNLTNASTVEGSEEIEYVPPLEIVRRPKSPKAMIPTGFNTGMRLLFLFLFASSSLQVWNGLPQTIRDIPSAVTFEKQSNTSVQFDILMFLRVLSALLVHINFVFHMSALYSARVGSDRPAQPFGIPYRSQ